MNVVQVPRRFVLSDWGGTETVLLETSKRLLALGHHTEIICPNALATCNAEVIEGVKVTRVPYFYPYFALGEQAKRRLDQKGGNLFSFALMRALSRYPGLQMLHLHTGKRVGGIVRHVARKRGIPYVISLHGGVLDVPEDESATWTSPTQGAWEWGKILGYWVGSRRVLNDAAAVICVGQEEQRRIRERYPAQKVHHLPNGVNARKFSRGEGARFRSRHQLAADERILLTVGRIDPQKNQLFLIRCLPEILKREPRARLILIGHVTNDDYYQSLLEEAVKLQIAHRVTIIPGLSSASPDLVDAYHAADLFILPSVHEPFGIVVLEAWASGLPVLASRVGGIPSFLTQGKEGLLFPPDEPSEFLRELFRLLDQPPLAAKLAAAGRAKALEEFDWDRIARRLLQIYEEVINENPLRK